MLKLSHILTNVSRYNANLYPQYRYMREALCFIA